MEKSNRKKINERNNFITAMWFLAPALILFGIFLVYPLIKTVYLSFFITNPKGEPVLFYGIDHYLDLFGSKSFRKSLRVTGIFAFLTVSSEISIALLLSVLCSRKLKGISFFRMIFSSSMGVSVAAGATIFMFLYHPAIGYFNQMLGTLGMAPVKWLTDIDTALYSVSMTTIWMNVGFGFLVLSAGLKSVPQYLYESSDIDGANFFQKLYHITFPMISPSIFYLAVVFTINSLQSFGQVDILTKGGPSESTNLLVYAVYQEAFKGYHFGAASAKALVLFAIVLAITFIQFKFERKVHYK